MMRHAPLMLNWTPESLKRATLSEHRYREMVVVQRNGFRSSLSKCLSRTAQAFSLGVVETSWYPRPKVGRQQDAK
jgi:hypothetical protein